MSIDADDLPDDVLLEICRVSRDDVGFSEELLVDLHTVSGLVGVNSFSRNICLEHAITLLTAAMAKLPKFNPIHIFFGHSDPNTRSDEWIDRATIERLAKQIAGLRWAESHPELVASQFNLAIGKAVRIGFLEERDYDTWQPGMASGSGWTSALSATTYGVTKARSASNNNGSKQQKAPIANKNPVFYLATSSFKPPTLGQDTVFYKTTDATIAQSLHRLFIKEYGGKAEQHHFALVSQDGASIEDQVLLDEALNELEVYADPDQGIYDPQPSRETMVRAQFARRATTWETTIQTKSSTQHQPNSQVDSRSQITTPPFSDSEELNAVFADINQCLRALEALSSHYNLLSSLERTGKVRGMAGSVDGIQFASEDDRRVHDDVERQINAATAALGKPLARVFAWGRDQRLDLPFDANELTSQIPYSWWDEDENRGHYEYYAFICEQYQSELDRISKALDVVTRKDSVAHIVLESYSPDSPTAIAEVTTLTLPERQTVLDALRKETLAYKLTFRILYEAHLLPADLILFQKRRDSIQAEFEGWKFGGYESENDDTFKVMLNAEDLIKRVIAKRKTNSSLEKPNKQPSETNDINVADGQVLKASNSQQMKQKDEGVRSLVEEKVSAASSAGDDDQVLKALLEDATYSQMVLTDMRRDYLSMASISRRMFGGGEEFHFSSDDDKDTYRDAQKRVENDLGSLLEPLARLLAWGNKRGMEISKSVDDFQRKQAFGCMADVCVGYELDVRNVMNALLVEQAHTQLPSFTPPSVSQNRTRTEGDHRPDGFYAPCTIVWRGIEHRCEVTKSEMAFLELGLRQSEIDVNLLMHAKSGLLWKNRYINSKKNRDTISKFLSRLGSRLSSANPALGISFSLFRSRDYILRTDPVQPTSKTPADTSRTARKPS